MKHMDPKVLEWLEANSKVSALYPARTLARLDPVHQWSAETVQVWPASWAPSMKREFLALCGHKKTENWTMSRTQDAIRDGLMRLFGIERVEPRNDPPFFRMQDESAVFGWLEAINRYRGDDVGSEDITEETKRHRSGTFSSASKKKVAKKTAASKETKTVARRAAPAGKKKAASKKAGRGRKPITSAASENNGGGGGRAGSFEHLDDMLKKLKRKSGASVADLAEEFGVEAKVIRAQIDRLRRQGHEISAIARGVFQAS